MPAFCFVVCRRQWHVMEKKRNPDKSMRSCSSATTDAWHLCKCCSYKPPACFSANVYRLITHNHTVMTVDVLEVDCFDVHLN